MIRRFISPRLWKHTVLASLLLLTPLAIVLARMTSGSTLSSGIPSPQIVSILRGLAGLELFLAAQICLLICWVRGASAVDFRGGYRTWRWMSILLLFASIMLVTGASLTLTDLIAGSLAPVIGSIEAARPALLLVPFGAVTAFVLRSLIPDMGRCRPAQILAVAAVVVAVWRTVSGLRGSPDSAEEGLAVLELLTGGFVLSAAEFYCRYVIHVNPNPPVVASHRQEVVKLRHEVREVDSAANMRPSESVVVSVHGDSKPMAISTLEIPSATPPAPDPQPEPAAVERSETPPATSRADSGNKTSRKKQRKAA